jgi:hypothetical protein
MVPKKQPILNNERTEELPAQEKIASGAESVPALSADQAYAQRFLDAPGNGSVFAQGFIP